MWRICIVHLKSTRWRLTIVLALFALLYWAQLIDLTGWPSIDLWVSWEQIWRYQITFKSTQFDETLKYGAFIKYLVIFEFLSKLLSGIMLTSSNTSQKLRISTLAHQPQRKKNYFWHFIIRKILTKLLWKWSGNTRKNIHSKNAELRVKKSEENIPIEFQWLLKKLPKPE